MVARGVPTRGLIALALTAALIATGSAAGDDRADRDPAAHTPSPAFAHALSRVVSVRVHHTRISTVRNTNARRIGRSLASLHPTWVTGLLRYARNQYPTHDEARAWRRDPPASSGANPGCAVRRRPERRSSTGPRRRSAPTMRRLRTKLGNEGWFFDFFSTAFRRHPRMIRAAINVGARARGMDRRQRLRAREAAAAARARRLLLGPGLGLSPQPARRPPARAAQAVLYHLNNDPARPAQRRLSLHQGVRQSPAPAR